MDQSLLESTVGDFQKSGHFVVGLYLEYMCIVIAGRLPVGSRTMFSYGFQCSVLAML